MAALLDASRWKHWLKTARNPPRYLVASLIVALGGLLNGLDSGTIGPVTAMPSFVESFGRLPPSVHGLVVSVICLPAAFISLFSGALSDSLGRTHTIAIGALIFALGAALEAGAVNLSMFIFARCMAGFAEGTFLSTLIVYVCEISPPRFRGPLATTVQLFITLGLVLGYFTCYGTVNIPSSLSWRLPLALQSGIAFFLAISSFFYLPESPRWLSYKGRKEEAILAWDKLGVSNAEREKDLLQNPTSAILSVPENPETIPLATPKLGFTASMRANVHDMMLVFGKSSRQPMMMGVFVMAMQQLSGIDGVIYYAPLLFQQAGLSSSSASFLASGVSAIMIFVFTLLAVFLSDRWGRRASSIWGGLLLFGCMALMALLYATDSVHATHGVARWIVILTIYIFSITYSMTWAFGLKIFASEIQPAATRASATSIAQAANFLTNFFVAFITPVLLAKSTSGAYFLFGGFCIITVGVCLVYMPETRGNDLESIGEAFGLHRAIDAPVIRSLRNLGSKTGTLLGLNKATRTHARASIEQSRGIELQTRR